MRPLREARSILIVKLSSLGDVLLASAVLPHIQACFPAALIDWVVETEGAEILRHNRALRRVIVFPRAAIQSALPRCIRAWRLWRAFRRDLRKDRYDLVLDLQGLARSWVVTLAARLAPADGVRAGKGRFAGIRYKSPHNRKYLRHALPSYFEVLSALGFPLPPLEDMRVSFALAPEGSAKAEKFIADHIGKNPYLIFHAFTTWRSKHWPEEHWARLALLCGARGFRVVISGAAADHARAEALLAKIYSAAASIEDAASPWAVSAAGSLDFAGFAALARGAHAVISVDSFPMHLAAASRAWVIALHGPTDPARTGPWGERCRAISAAGVSCPMRAHLDSGASPADSVHASCRRAPCRKRYCRDIVCMRGITPEDVLAVLDSVCCVDRAAGSPIQASRFFLVPPGKTSKF